MIVESTNDEDEVGEIEVSLMTYDKADKVDDKVISDGFEEL